ncbi:LOB domain-containing protein 29 [Phtheirospermum japonicum]|uniref:LOB domain-containing protein 29 n=1 Tax=Phtheirospermum japonicum TaxID=374723 RepID=A0A830DPV9_9LAMI|nr:LOB domain-containing protein 29 [Phtheirospermum japonicum]
MNGSGSPCGACKFLRRKCVKGCVFAPYFSHEQGAAHFSAIHKVFGASNVSKLLSHLPIADRCEAAVTIAYEAQARVQDPIYGCVSHIFALQQQVMYLQAQLASFKEQAAAQGIINSSNTTENPNNHGESDFFPQDVQSNWFQSQVTNPQLFDANLINNAENMHSFANYGTVNNPNPNPVKYEKSGFQEEITSMESQWQFQDDSDDLQSVAFRYIRRS